MSDYFTLLTTIGQAKLATAAIGGVAMDIAAVRVGDGGGVAYTPTEAQTALVGEKYTAAISTVLTQAGGVIVIEALIPANVNDGGGRPSGGWTVREAGVFDGAGNLLAIAKAPESYKPLPSSGASEDMTLRLVLDVGNAGNVTVLIDPASTIGLARLGRAPWLAVDSVTNVPPPLPPTGATVLVGTAPTGAFAGHANKLAQWVGLWSLVVPPADTVIAVASRTTDDPSRYLKRVGLAWQNAAASTTAYGFATLATAAEHLPGIKEDEAATPAGVAAMLKTKFTRFEQKTTPSTGTFVPPAGCFQIYVEGSGPGGGAGGSYGHGAGAGGNGGGGFEGVYDCTPGVGIPWEVGAGGTGGPPGASGQAGGRTKFGGWETSGAGAGGAGSNAAGTTGASATVTATGNVRKRFGSTGGYGSVASGLAQGGPGGTCPGGAGPATSPICSGSDLPGYQGATGNGGSGGASLSGSGVAGGAGGDGELVWRY